jgi:hypothetical protein
MDFDEPEPVDAELFEEVYNHGLNELPKALDEQKKEIDKLNMQLDELNMHLDNIGVYTPSWTNMQSIDDAVAHQESESADEPAEHTRSTSLFETLAKAFAFLNIFK